MRLCYWPVMEDRSRVTDRNDVIFPIAGEFLHAVHHFSGRQLFPGRKLPAFLLAGGKNLDVRTADINC